MARLILTLCAVLLSPLAQALDWHALEPQLARNEPVRGAFEQQKQLPFLQAPMVSAGDYLLVPGQGLIWSQQTPWPQQTVLKGNEIWQDGQPVASGGEAFAPLLGALLGGNLSQLADQFEIDAEGSPEQWTLTLIPKQAPLSTLFASIALSGTAQLDHIRLVDSAGAPTEIALLNTQPAQLTEPERAQLR